MRRKRPCLMTGPLRLIADLAHIGIMGAAFVPHRSRRLLPNPLRKTLVQRGVVIVVFERFG